MPEWIDDPLVQRCLEATSFLEDGGEGSALAAAGLAQPLPPLASPTTAGMGSKGPGLPRSGSRQGLQQLQHGAGGSGVDGGAALGLGGAAGAGGAGSATGGGPPFLQRQSSHRRTATTELHLQQALHQQQQQELGSSPGHARTEGGGAGGGGGGAGRAGGGGLRASSGGSGLWQRMDSMLRGRSEREQQQLVTPLLSEVKVSGRGRAFFLQWERGI